MFMELQLANDFWLNLIFYSLLYGTVKEEI